MLRPSEIIIDAFVERLLEDHRTLFREGHPEHASTLADVARMSLSRIATSNAPYHDINHTIVVTLVGQDMLRGRIVRNGDVDSTRWTQFVASLLCFAIGFVRDLCPGDRGSLVVTDEAGTTVTIPRGATDGFLWPYFTDRGKMFVRQYFRDHPVLDAEAMARSIEYSRFPPPEDRNLETDTDPGLLRAAHIIGAVADPDFLTKAKSLLLELDESGIAAKLGFQDVADLKVGYPKLFWSMLHPQIGDGMALLRHTGRGRAWLARLHAHVLTEEHRMQIGSERRVRPG